MIHCWICKAPIDDPIGTRGEGGSAVGICKPCNKTYSLIRSIVKLPREELITKEAGLAHRLVIYNTVRDHRKDMTVGELAKEVLRRRGLCIQT